MSKLCFLVISSLILCGISPTIFAENVPAWVKNTAGWWATDAISETEFVNAVGFLVKENIIRVNVLQASETSQSVPEWVKNTAGWWANNQISEKEFVNAIGFLVNTGIIIIEKQISPQYEIEEFFEKKVIEVTEDDFDPQYNSYGLRGPEFKIEKPDDVYRIIAVGGSTTYGNGVEDEFTWPVLLQNSLNEIGSTKKIEVINGATAGITNIQQYMFIKNDYIDLEPDLFILYQGANDITCMMSEFHNDYTNWNKEKFLQQCGEHYPSEHPVALAERFTEICQIGKKNNFEVFVIFQPLVNLKGKTLTTQELKSFFDNPSLGVMVDNYDLLKQTVLKETHSCNSVSDLSSIFDNYDVPLYFDRAHTGNLGNTLIAENIFDLTLPLLLEKNIILDIPSDLKKTEQFQFVLGEDLSESDFSSQNLDNKNFFGANLRGSNFDGAVLSNTDFRLSNLENVNFANAKIDNMKLQQNILDGAIFTNVDFINVDLENVDLSYTNLQNANLSNKNLERTFLYKSDLRGADLSLSEMSNIFLNGADLSSTNLKGAMLKSVNFSTIKSKSLKYADISFTGFSHSDFRGVELPMTFHTTNFFLAKMQDIDLSDRIIHATAFYETNLNGANFDNVNMSDRRLMYTINDPPSLDPARLKEQITALPVILITDITPFDKGVKVSVIQYNNFAKADLQGSSFKNADLKFANFYLANLSNADLSGADLRNAFLGNADLSNANLEGANLEGATMTCFGHDLCTN